MSSFAASTLRVEGDSYSIFRLDALQDRYDVERLPYTLKILLENVLRLGDDEDVEAVATWDARADPTQEISFTPARVLLQDFTGVPRSSISRRCATRCASSAATPRRSIRSFRPSS